jgi:hypothetical protein
MSLTPSLVSQPLNYSPVFGDLWFQSQSASYSVSNYKYVFDLVSVNPTTGSTQSLGRYKVPSAPDTRGLFNPNRILQTQLTYDLNPTIVGITQSNNSILGYRTDIGFEWSPNLSFVNTFEAVGFLCLTFSTPHSLANGDQIIISKDDRTTNYEYNGLATIASIINTHAVRTNKAYLATPIVAETGTITSQLRITGSSSTLLTFNGVRSYELENFNFGTSSTYLIDGTTASSGNTFSLTNYRFCSGSTPEYNGAKYVNLDDFETLSYLVDNTSNNIKTLTLKTWNSNLSPINTFTSSVSPGMSRRVDVGTGPLNIKSLFGNSVLNGALYYSIMFGGANTNDTWGIYHYKIKDNDPRATCSPYPKIRLCWLNRLGGFDYFTFNFKSKNTISAGKTEFKRQLTPTFNGGERQDYVLSTKVEEMWSISSDFITENESNWLKELITSPEVYVISGSTQNTFTRLPIIITDSSYEVKTYLNDKLFAMSVNYKVAYPVRVQQS